MVDPFRRLFERLDLLLTPTPALPAFLLFISVRGKSRDAQSRISAGRSTVQL
jgi:hypothetical protein